MNEGPRDPSAHESAHRLLLVFAPSAEDGAFAHQRDLIEGHEAAFDDRDLVTLTFFEDGRRDSVEARRRYGVAAGGFAAVLVGKDGGEKFRSGGPVRPEALFELIDAMPMRRREVREGR